MSTTDQSLVTVIDDKPVTTTAAQLPNNTPLPAENMLGAIMQMASDPECNVDNMERMMNLYKQMQDQQAKQDFAQALSQLQGEMPHVEKKRQTTGGAKFKFRNLDDILFHANPLLKKYGFSLTHHQTISDNHTTVTTKLGHSGGHETTISVTLPNDSTNGAKDAIKAALSTTTFCQRRNVESLLNISGKDETSAAPPSGKTITPEQATEAKDLIKRLADTIHPVDMEGLKEFIGADSIDEMTTAKFPPTMRMLRQRLLKAESENTEKGE